MEKIVLRKMLCTTIHPSRWVTIERGLLNDSFCLEISDQSCAELMDALDEFRCLQSLYPLPPASVVQERLRKLRSNPSKAENILALPNVLTETASIDDRSYQRSKLNTNLYIWTLLHGVGISDISQLTVEHIDLMSANAKTLARSERAGGSTTQGRAEIPGLVDLVVHLIKIWAHSGGAGSPWYRDSAKDNYNGFLGETLDLILSINELINHLETFHGGSPPESPILVDEKVLQSFERSLDSVLSEATVLSYYKKAKSVLSDG